MTPFLEQLVGVLGLVLAGASVLGIVWGAARRQRGREAVDDQHATKITSLAATTKATAAKATENRERVIVLETKLEALE